MKGFVEVTSIVHRLNKADDEKKRILLNLNTVVSINLDPISGREYHIKTNVNDFNVSESDFKRILAEIRS